MKSRQINRTNFELVMANNSLSHYLFNLSRGRTATPHSWLYEDKKSETVLQSWISIMTSANNISPFGDIFNQFDLAQVEKFGPQGAVPPIQSKECLEVIEPLFSPSEYDDGNALSQYFEDADKFGLEIFGISSYRTRPKSFETVIDDMSARDTLSSNSGFPRFVRRGRVQDKEIQDAKTGKAYEYPAIILFRQYNGKLRPVWMFPMSLNLVEFSFSQIIQDKLKQSSLSWVRDYLSPWQGYEDVKLTLTKHWHGQQIDGGDTTKMDAHMRLAQITLVYRIVRVLFQRQYWDALYRSLTHICEIPLLYSVDREFVGAHGLASGSGWTQLTETVLQLFMTWRAKLYGQGIGDDFYWISDMTADELVEYLALYGLPANPKKQSVEKDQLTFLQRLNVQGFYSRESSKVLGAYYPTIRGLNSMLNPEKFHSPKMWNSDMFCTRNYMILENCVDNPCFEDFVDFVVRGHKDMIPFAKQKPAVLNEIQCKARLVPGLNPSYNQEKRLKPLSSFASIRLAALK